jgi:hypothetical protein
VAIGGYGLEKRLSQDEIPHRVGIQEGDPTAIGVGDFDRPCPCFHRALSPRDALRVFEKGAEDEKLASLSPSPAAQ